MKRFSAGEIDIETDDEGFLLNPDDWNAEVATALAATEEIPALTDEHWKILHFLREYNVKYGVAPMIRHLCKATNTPLQRMYELFPSGPAMGACKIAGLPRPTGCV